MSGINGQQILRKTFNANESATQMLNMGSLVPESFDEVALSYTGSNLTTAVYKKATVTIATLTLTYSGSNLTNVVRT